MSGRLRVVMDASVLRHGLGGGIAQYTWQLARALLALEDAPALTLWFAARASKAAAGALAELAGLGARVVRAPAPWAWSPDGAWWLPAAPPTAALLRRADVFHAGEFQLPRAVPAACIATIHDLSTLTHPGTHTALNRAVHGRRIRWIERRADRVVAPSEATRAEILRRTRIPPERIDRIPEARTTGAPPDAARVQAVLRRHGLAGTRYVLAVGTREPRKNHGRLLAAFESLPGHFDDVRLVLAGPPGWRAQAFERALARSPARERVRLLGFVPAEELPALYAGAAACAYPSLDEGFGLPLLDAFAAGTPTLTGGVSAMAEVAGDAALLVDPLSVESIRAGLERLLGDDALRARLAERGRRREREFSWRRTASETLASYERALAERRGMRGAFPAGVC